ncbi:MAG: hypothetical protein HC904_04790 [Blastochloris sp.]|nr:hypothetical protein [Blastochloris sp.]
MNYATNLMGPKLTCIFLALNILAMPGFLKSEQVIISAKMAAEYNDAETSALVKEYGAHGTIKELIGKTLQLRTQIVIPKNLPVLKNGASQGYISLPFDYLPRTDNTISRPTLSWLDSI